MERVLDIMALEVGRFTSHTPWSRIHLIGGAPPRLPLEVPPELSYGEFMRRLVTGLSMDPPYTVPELVEARTRRICTR